MEGEMIQDDRRRPRGLGGAMMVVTFALLAIGLVMVGSASGSLDASLLQKSLWRTSIGRQAIFALAGLGIMVLLARHGRLLLERPSVRRFWTWALFAGVVGCLIVTLVPQLTSESHGARRWIYLGPRSWGLGFQPSEFAKLALVALLAWQFSREGSNPRSLVRGFLPSAVIVGVFVALVGVEDFGTAALLGVVGGALMFTAGCRILHLILSGAMGVIGLCALILIEPYRLDRIKAFLDPLADPLGSGYHPMQSLMTIASGGWTGTGLGSGVQKQGYLPECSTDFIFAVVCEETGVLGGLTVIGLFLVMVWLGLRVVWLARTPFERLLATGITALIGLQAAMNIAVATVSAPTTGISLPLMSAGGSGLIVFCTAIGLLAAAANRIGDPGVEPTLAGQPFVTDRAVKLRPAYRRVWSADHGG